MTDVGVEFLRRQTLDFIALDPTTITLIPTVESKLPGGGTETTVGEPREPQEFKVIWVGGQATGIIRSADGSDRQYDFVLVGPYDCLLDIGDHWFDGGVKYVVEGFAPYSAYQKKAGVKAYGAKPNGG